MKVDEWLNFFKHHKEKKLFSLSDIVQLTGENKPSLSVQLTRLIKAGVINRASRIWYENPFIPPSSEEIAMVIRYPSYLSMEYALSKQGLLSQTVYTLTLVTTKLPYTYRTDRVIYEYHQISKSLFWGYQREGTVLIAQPEKALLDLIHIRCVKTRELTVRGVASLVDDMALHELDLKKLHMYSERFTPKTRKIIAELEI
jgi:predicted transcriptional regulator of viral defense system